MNKKNLILLVATLATLTSTPIKTYAADTNKLNTIAAVDIGENTKELPTKYDVPKNKTFEVKFNREINFISVNSNTVKVVDSEGNEIPVKLTSKTTDNTVVIVEAPTDGYKEGGTYALIIRKGINSLNSFKLVDETVMKFVIAASTSGGSTGETSQTKRDSLDVILYNYRGGKTYSPYTSLIRRYDFYSEYVKDPVAYEKNLEYFIKPLYKNMPYNVREWYPYVETKGGEYTKIRNDFNDKYLNSTYADITDINYFTKMSTNLDFSQANNSDIVPKHAYNTNNRFFTGVGVRTALEGANQATDIRLQYIWRPDVEKELLKLLNEERKKQGLGKLTLNNDLKAIAMYATKKQTIYNLLNQSQYTQYTPILNGATAPGPIINKISKDFVSSFTYKKVNKPTEPNYMNANLTGRVSGASVEGVMAVDYIPLTNKNSNYINSPFLDGTLSYDTVFDGEKFYLPLTELGKKLGYKNYSSLVAVADGNGYIDSAEDIIDVWYDSDVYNFRKINGRVYTNEFSENAKLFNPKLKQVGIAVSYSIPKVPLEGQGIMNVYIIFSE